MATSADRMRRLRERRAAGIEPGRAVLRDADELLAPAVEETLAALKLGERDTAAVQLARGYAAQIDQGGNPVAAMKTFGPLLLKVLNDLGATPAARAGVKPRPPERRGPNQIARLRAEHAQSPAVRRRRGLP
jgi:hypothetical protein